MAMPPSRARNTVVGSRATPQHPELAIWGLGPGMPAHTIRSWQRRHEEDAGGEKGVAPLLVGKAMENITS